MYNLGSHLYLKYVMICIQIYCTFTLSKEILQYYFYMYEQLCSIYYCFNLLVDAYECS